MRLHRFAHLSVDGEGMSAVRDYICTRGEDEIFAFAGASGVGKSTLIGSIFSELKLETGRISEKTARGRHTTRAVTLFSCDCGGERMFIADTPGFSMLDFINFNFSGWMNLCIPFPNLKNISGVADIAAVPIQKKRAAPCLRQWRRALCRKAAMIATLLYMRN